MSDIVRIGDRFRRPGMFLEIYQVIALRAYDRHLVLADLILEGIERTESAERLENDVMTIPVSTLLNPKQWRPVGG